MKRDDFEKLVLKTLDGDCTSEEFRALEMELQNSPRARAIWREANLTEAALAGHSENLRNDSSDQIVPIEILLEKQRRRTFALALSAAALVLLFLGMTLHFFMAKENIPFAAMQIAPGSELSIAKAENRESQDAGLQKGDKLTLTVGAIELTMASGATAIIRGPAELELTDPMEIRMEYGTGYFNVPDEAVGFRVVTPRVKIVDLGTAFGVISHRENAEPPEVHVFKGKVQAFARDGLKDIRTILADEATRISIAGRLPDIDPDPSAFPVTLPTELPYVRFSFEPDGDGNHKTGGQLASEQKITAKLQADGPSPVPGVNGMAANFTGRSSPIVSNWKGPLASKPFTISAWIRQSPDLPHRQFQTIAGWGDTGETSDTKVELLLRQETPNDTAKLRLRLGQAAFTGSTQLADGKWHHVAAVVSNQHYLQDYENVRFFVNGREEKASLSFPEKIQPSGEPKSYPVMIGHLPQEWNGRYFRGEIDELRIYECALSSQGISKLSRNPD